ncbi:MAG: alpha-E domain-containing protein, partial [Ilumatobacteraceae bacterium]|nr:alpha-E domain-containing protein [Ilumatobacteraceae bacterium]
MLLSRVADNLYWGARYLERAEDTARVVRNFTELILDLPRGVGSSWEPLLAVAGSRAEYDEGHARAHESDIVRFLVADLSNGGSVVSSVAAARENLRTTREVFPRDAWQAVNDLYLFTSRDTESGVDRRSRARYLGRVITD